LQAHYIYNKKAGVCASAHRKQSQWQKR